MDIDNIILEDDIRQISDFSERGKNIVKTSTDTARNTVKFQSSEPHIAKQSAQTLPTKVDENIRQPRHLNKPSANNIVEKKTFDFGGVNIPKETAYLAVAGLIISGLLFYTTDERKKN